MIEDLSLFTDGDEAEILDHALRVPEYRIVGQTNPYPGRFLLPVQGGINFDRHLEKEGETFG